MVLECFFRCFAFVYLSDSDEVDEIKAWTSPILEVGEDFVVGEFWLPGVLTCDHLGPDWV